MRVLLSVLAKVAVCLLAVALVVTAVILLARGIGWCLGLVL